MNVNEYLNQLPARRDSKLAPYKEELRVLYFGKASAAATQIFLRDRHGLIVSRQAIWEFCKRHFSRDTNTPGSGSGQSSPEINSPPDPSHEQTGVPAHAGSQSVESRVILRNDESKAPAFQPATHVHLPNIEHSNPRAGDASKLMAFWSESETPRRSKTESQKLDERSEALKAEDRKQRREQPR
ncbi:hypothetical protein AWB69_07785 [Caballeronia udeis]|uniref:Uncharacterized protein n=1 Tax=Caballeronia udeis TaxID=1232866 RepID=A0A158JF96_9BURK|nr:hypothetical protein AWB69_07785 [Caballeronia udeis]